MVSARLAKRAAHFLATLTAAVALLVAPVAASLRAACDLCPRDCPMHAIAQQPKSAKLGCHGSSERATPQRGGVRLTRPPCRDHASLGGSLAQQPMLRAAVPAMAAPHRQRFARPVPAALPSAAAPRPQPRPPRFPA